MRRLRPDCPGIQTVSGKQDDALPSRDPQARPGEGYQRPRDTDHHEVAEAHDLGRYLARRSWRGETTDTEDVANVRTDDVAEGDVTLAVHNFTRRLKTLEGLTPCEYIFTVWTSDPDRFIL